MIFKQIFRIAFIALVWKQYKGIIISSTLLLAYILLVGSIHSEYITVKQLKAETDISGISFIYKWLAYTIGVVTYFAYHFFRAPSSPKEDLNEKAKQANINAKSDESDPFAAIRKMDKLRSRADFIEQQNKDS